MQDLRSLYKWKILVFDTDLFGIKTAKIEFIKSCGNWYGDKQTIAVLLEDLKKNRVEYVSYRITASEFSIIHALEKNGFILIDGIIEMEVDLKDTVSNQGNINIRKASIGDLEKLKTLSSKSYSYNRFYNDPEINKNKADELYAKWAENSLKGEAADMVLVYSDSNRILGYITLQDGGHIPLIAVDKTERGKGIGTALIKSALTEFYKKGIRKIKIETQMQNIPALRIYLKSGFNVIGSSLTFRWKEEKAVKVE